MTFLFAGVILCVCVLVLTVMPRSHAEDKYVLIMFVSP